MTKLEEAVIEAAKQLPKKLKRKLADELLDGDEPLSPEWMEEIDQRIAAIDSGELQPIPGEKVMSRVRSRLRQVRSGGSNGKRK